jgi:methanogenic corrinoid protein MtbC1
MIDQQPHHLELESALLSLNKVATRRIYKESGLAPIDFAEKVFMPVLDRIGNKWERGEIALSQVYMSGRICESLLNELLPSDGPDLKTTPPLAVAVLEDSHLLGKRILCSVLRASGYKINDFGQQHVETLVTRVQSEGIRILLVSTLMLSSALRVKELRRRLDTLNFDVKLVVGGAPFRFDQELWKEVGADATSPTASGAIGIVQRLTREVTDENV